MSSFTSNRKLPIQAYSGAMPGKVDSSFCIWLFIMPRVSNVQKARAIGQIQAGILQQVVAERLGVSPGTITKWKQKFQATGDVKDRPRTGRPKITTEQQDRYIRVLALQDRRRTSKSIQRSVVRRYKTRVSDQTVRNRLHAAHLRARKPAKKPAMTA